jgi:hypothetical protein
MGLLLRSSSAPSCPSLNATTVIAQGEFYRRGGYRAARRKCIECNPIAAKLLRHTQGAANQRFASVRANFNVLAEGRSVKSPHTVSIKFSQVSG